MTLAERTFESGLVMADGKTERRPATIALLLIAQLGSEIEKRLRAKSQFVEGRSQASVGKSLGIPPFLAAKFFDAVHRTELPSLQKQLEAVHQADLALKTSAQDHRMLAESLLVRLRA